MLRLVQIQNEGRRRLAVVRPAGGVRRGLPDRGHVRLRHPPGGTLMPPAPTAPVANAPATTGSRASRILGLLSLVGLALLLMFSLVWSPPDEVQQDAVRLVYAHVGIAIWAFGGCAITTVASAMWVLACWARSAARFNSVNAL